MIRFFQHPPTSPGSWVPKRFSKQTSTADSGVEGTDHRLDVGGNYNGNDFDGGADDWRGPMRQVLQLGIRRGWGAVENHWGGIFTSEKNWVVDRFEMV